MLKQLIQRLLDSRTTPQQAKDCNDLDFSKEITVLNTTAISSANFTYIAPDAGYIYRWIQCSGKSGTAMGADIIVNGKRMSGLAINNGYFEFGETIRVNKGNSVKFGTWGLSTLAQYLVKFVPLGGGYNRFIRRALSCLRPSFNYLPRSFCKAKNLGFQNNQLLSSIRALISLAQAPRISLVTSLRATAGQLLDATQIQSQLLKSKSRTGRWHLLPFLTETLRELESVVTLKKGHRLSSCVVAEVQPIILFGSTRQVQTFNPLTGGALC
jgi:hypothetical protein